MENKPDPSEIVVAITGASGAIYGVRTLEALHAAEQTTTLIITSQAKKILELETDYSPARLEELADHVYDEYDFTAPVASGSHKFKGMIICPCSMKTLGSIAAGIASNLVVRTADVCLKEGRPLLLVPRETPLSTIHLENMLKIDHAGGRIIPACPGFYNKPTDIDELVDGIVNRVLDLLGVKYEHGRRWGD